MYKTIVILSDVEEYQYEEIAEFLNRPVGTVRSRLHRARKLLHDELGSYARRTGYLAA
jgi:RNA polymerase sigma-70 factor (ECF subfamily)